MDLERYHCNFKDSPGCVSTSTQTLILLKDSYNATCYIFSTLIIPATIKIIQAKTANVGE